MEFLNKIRKKFIKKSIPEALIEVSLKEFANWLHEDFWRNFFKTALVVSKIISREICTWKMDEIVEELFDKLQINTKKSCWRCFWISCTRKNVSEEFLDKLMNSWRNFRNPSNIAKEIVNYLPLRLLKKLYEKFIKKFIEELLKKMAVIFFLKTVAKYFSLNVLRNIWRNCRINS